MWSSSMYSFGVIEISGKLHLKFAMNPLMGNSIMTDVHFRETVTTERDNTFSQTFLFSFEVLSR